MKIAGPKIPVSFPAPHSFAACPAHVAQGPPVYRPYSPSAGAAQPKVAVGAPPVYRPIPAAVGQPKRFPPPSFGAGPAHVAQSPPVYRPYGASAGAAQPKTAFGAPPVYRPIPAAVGQPKRFALASFAAGPAHSPQQGPPVYRPSAASAGTAQPKTAVGAPPVYSPAQRPNPFLASGSLTQARPAIQLMATYPQMVFAPTPVLSASAVSVIQMGRNKGRKKNTPSKRKAWKSDKDPSFLAFRTRGYSLNHANVRPSQNIHYPSPPSSPYTPSEDEAIEEVYRQSEARDIVLPQNAVIGIIGEHEIEATLIYKGTKYVDVNKVATNFPGIDFLVENTKPFWQSKYHLGDGFERAYISDIENAEDAAAKAALYLFKRNSIVARQLIINKAKEWNNEVLLKLATELQNEDRLGDDENALDDMITLIAENMVYPTHSDHSFARRQRGILLPRRHPRGHGVKIQHALTYKIEKPKKEKKKLVDSDYVN
jgi:hypothetical protein